jgi:hypothetical protein
MCNGQGEYDAWEGSSFESWRTCEGCNGTGFHKDAHDYNKLSANTALPMAQALKECLEKLEAIFQRSGYEAQKYYKVGALMNVNEIAEDTIDRVTEIMNGQGPLLPSVRDGV